MFKFLLSALLLSLTQASSYKEDLFQILKLEYSTASSLESVNSLLSDLSTSLRSSQESDDRLNKTRQLECTAEITFLDRPIEVMFSEITRAKQIVAEKSPKFDHTQQLIHEKDSEIQYLTQSLQSLDRNYVRDSDSLKDSYIEHEQALKAVSGSLSLLKDSELSVTSTRIPDNSEHTEIVGLSFLQTDQESFSRLVDIFTDIRNNLQGYLKANNARKVQIDGEHSRLRGALERVKAGVQELRDNLDAESLDLAEDIEEANRMINEAQEECGSMVRAKADKETECGAWTRQYVYETEKRNEEMRIIFEISQMVNQDISALE